MNRWHTSQDKEKQAKGVEIHMVEIQCSCEKRQKEKKEFFNELKGNDNFAVSLDKI